MNGDGVCGSPLYVESPTSQFLQLRSSFCAVIVYALIDSTYRGGPQSSDLTKASVFPTVGILQGPFLRHPVHNSRIRLSVDN